MNVIISKAKCLFVDFNAKNISVEFRYYSSNTLA